MGDKEKPLMEIMRESAAKNFAPLFRGTVPLMGHSLASAILGLVGQPRLQKYIQDELGSTGMLGKSATNLVDAAKGHHRLRGLRRDRRRYGQVWPRRHLPRPGHWHCQGDRLAHPLPRGPHVADPEAQGAQRAQRMGAQAVS